MGIAAPGGDRYRSQLNVRLRTTTEDVPGQQQLLGQPSSPQQFFSAANSNPFWNLLGNRREMSVSANALNMPGNNTPSTNPFIPESLSAEILVPNTPGVAPPYPITPVLLQPAMLPSRRPSSVTLPGPSPLISRRIRKASSASTDDGRVAAPSTPPGLRGIAPSTPPGLRGSDRKVI